MSKADLFSTFPLPYELLRRPSLRSVPSSRFNVLILFTFAKESNFVLLLDLEQVPVTVRDYDKRLILIEFNSFLTYRSLIEGNGDPSHEHRSSTHKTFVTGPDVGGSAPVRDRSNPGCSREACPG